MTIAIIGSGNVGGALAQSLIKGGHTVLIGAKHRCRINQSGWQPSLAKTG